MSMRMSMRAGSAARKQVGRDILSRSVARRRCPVALMLALFAGALLAAQLAGCAASLPAAAASTAATPTATPLPTVAPTKGDDTSLPPLAASVAQCAQAPTFQGAQPASAGATFADVPFPPQSWSVTGAATDNLYHFQIVAVCTENGGGAAFALAFYARQMRAGGWTASATYPYGGDPQHACGDPYCWRMAAKTVRYVSLEHLSSNGAVTVYVLRLATGPTPSASLVVRSASGAGRAGQTLTVSASCAGGEQMLGGGFSISGADHTYTASSSYPSGPASWTVTAVGAGSAIFELETSVGCLSANYSLGMQVVPVSFQVAAGAAPQGASASCPSGVVTGGGAQLAGGGALLADSAPAPGGAGWSVVATAGSGGAKGTAYALCATRHLDAGPSTSRPFTIYTGADAQASLGCATGQWLTSGGFSNTDPSADGKNVYGLDGPTADYSRWFLQGHNLDSSSAHGATIWAVCDVPDPQF